VPIGMGAVVYRLWLEFSETAQTAGMAVRETIEEGSLVVSAFSSELINLIRFSSQGIADLGKLIKGLAAIMAVILVLENLVESLPRIRAGRVKAWLTAKKILAMSGRNPEANLDRYEESLESAMGRSFPSLRDVLSPDSQGSLLRVNSSARNKLENPKVEFSFSCLELPVHGARLSEGDDIGVAMHTFVFEVASSQSGGVRGKKSYKVKLEVFPCSSTLSECVCSCECMDHAIRGAGCKHLAAVLRQMESTAQSSGIFLQRRLELQEKGVSSGSRPAAIDDVPLRSALAKGEAARASWSPDGGVQAAGSSIRQLSARNKMPKQESNLRAEEKEKVKKEARGSLVSALDAVGCTDWTFFREKALKLTSSIPLRKGSDGEAPSSKDVQSRATEAIQKAEAEKEKERELVASSPLNSVLHNCMLAEFGGRDERLGELVTILTAVRTHEVSMKLLQGSDSKSIVYLMGYTFDREDVASELVNAKARGADVKVILDKRSTVSGPTKSTPQVMMQLFTGCVEVRLTEGRGLAAEYAAVERFVGSHLKGIQHSKTLLVDDWLLVGSTNWTTSSRSNLERTCLIQLHAAKVPDVQAEHVRVWGTAEQLTKEGIQASMRSKSASASR